MSKSMGFEEENTYLDSKAVAHNNKPLNEVLDEMLYKNIVTGQEFETRSYY